MKVTVTSKTIGLLVLNFLIVGGIIVGSQLTKLNQQKQLDKLMNTGKETVLGLVAKNTSCQINGALPDPNCTPGAIFPLATVEEVCVPGYTKTVRNVSAATKKQVYEMYGLESTHARGDFEVDHHIPLALGGNNEVANLWPEAADPRPGFKEKDVVEVYLHEKVCAHQIDLTAAQQQIAKDWLAVYKIISLDEAKRIKQIYKNWSN